MTGKIAPSRTLSLMGVAMWAWCCNLSASEHTDAEVQLLIRPAICVLATDETVCRDEVSIMWEADVMLSACLYQAMQTAGPERCWENATQGKFSLVIATEQSVSFELRSSTDNRVIARDELHVMHEQQRYRARRRSAWSFF